MLVRPTMMLLLMALPALADDTASLRTALAGNTVKGRMAASGPYIEYYSKDGTIRSDGYKGNWSLEGDQMCFSYEGDPAACWQVRLSGNTVSFWSATGEEGQGAILPGNPNGY